MESGNHRLPMAWGSPRLVTGLALGLPIMAAIILMLPRLLHAEFGMFDDPVSVSIARQTWDGTWDVGADAGQFGRFRPAYWLGFSLIYGLAGTRPTWYFAANLLLLAGTAALLSAVVHRLTRSTLAAAAAGLAFTLGGPVIEASYTLSKPELQQCFLLTAYVGTLCLPPRPQSRVVRAGRWLLATTLFLVATLTKETTGIVLVILACWQIASWLARHLLDRRAAPFVISLPSEALSTAGLGVGVYVVSALVLSADTFAGAGPRANFSLTGAAIVSSARIWLDWIVRDWLYLLPLLTAACVLFVTQRKIKHVHLALGSVLWMVVWFALYLPYRFSPEYYLLPFSLGVSVLAGVLVHLSLDAILQSSGVARGVAVGCAAAAVLLFGLTIPNNASNGGIQIAADRANAAMLRFVAHEAPPSGLVLVNIRDDVEYLWGVGGMLREVYGRSDLKVEGYLSSYGDLQAEGASALIVSPFVENMPYPSVRLGLRELLSREWEASLQKEVGARLQLLREVKYGMSLMIVDAPRLICLAAAGTGYCQVEHAPFDTRRFAEGWKIYSFE